MPSSWPDETRRRLLVALGLSSSPLNNLDLWEKLFDVLNFRMLEVLAARLRLYADPYPPEYAAQKLSGVALAFTSGAAPDGLQGVGYNFTYTASGGVPAYIFTVSAGALPDGLTLNPVSGLLSGTPTVANTFVYTVRVTDAAGVFVSFPESVTIVL